MHVRAASWGQHPPRETPQTPVFFPFFFLSVDFVVPVLSVLYVLEVPPGLIWNINTHSCPGCVYKTYLAKRGGGSVGVARPWTSPLLEFQRFRGLASATPSFLLLTEGFVLMLAPCRHLSVDVGDWLVRGRLRCPSTVCSVQPLGFLKVTPAQPTKTTAVSSR